MTVAADDLFAQIEAARAEVDRAPGDASAAYRLALAYARAGATGEAERVARAHALAERFAGSRGALPVALWEDIGCLPPRLAKDRALLITEPLARAAALRAAAAGYAAVARRTGGPYPMINAATLSLLAGDVEAAAANARTTLALLGDGRADYWDCATACEAHLVLGDAAAAGREARFALALGPGFDDLTATLRQLRHVAAARGVDAAWLDGLAPAPVVHFAGHVVGPPEGGGRVPATDEAEVARRLDAALARLGKPGPLGGAPFSAAYGALAAGADILIAEWMLRAGAPLHVVLPYDIDGFIETSVRPSGAAWVGRFRRCADRAASLRVAAQGDGTAEPALLAYGSRYAMGLATLRARTIGTEAIQVALCDGEPADEPAGTAADVAAWAATGRRQTLVRPPDTHPRARHATAAGDARRRVSRAILFADLKGFSALPDRLSALVAELVFGAFARVLAPHRASGALVEANTWGDAALIVMTDVVAAAEAALGLMAALDDPALAEAFGGTAPSMRVGGHFGPVFEAFDPLRERACVVGAHMSVGARIEPVAPVGAVWVTEHFAAALTFAGAAGFACEVVGRTRMAKDFGELRVFRLSRAPAV